MATRGQQMVQRMRLDKCQRCPQRVNGWMNQAIPPGTPVALTHRCNLCKCFVRAKTLVPAERCPMGYW